MADISTRKSYDNSETLQKNMDNIVRPGTSHYEWNDKTEYPQTREEIVARRKLKVAARKQIKKLEKQSINEKKVAVEQVEKPGFSLQLALEDFPTLDTIKTKKRISISNQETTSMVIENISPENLMIKEPKSSKTTEKSWKPKVKDPIRIDLSQALQHTTEKHKPVLKKIDTPTQRNNLSGNILDSDNPKRKKGKVRPDKVQKPSKLKSHILHERIERKKMSEVIENNSDLNESMENNNKKLCDTASGGEKNVLFTCCEFSETEENRITDERKLIETNQKEVCRPTALSNIHSRRFREYCTNCLTEELITSVCALLEKVAYFQDRMYAREPIKASAKRRYVAGINQTSKYLQVKKVKLLIIAPDLEKHPGEGGLDEKVQYLKMEAESQSIPCVFGPNRKRLGKAVKKNSLISCVAVLSCEGAEEQCAKVLEALDEAKTKYLKLTGFHEDTVTKNNDNNSKADEKYASASEVTSSLLATLREELPPADRLLAAIQRNDSRPEE